MYWTDGTNDWLRCDSDSCTSTLSGYTTYSNTVSNIHQYHLTKIRWYGYTPDNYLRAMELFDNGGGSLGKLGSSYLTDNNSSTGIYYEVNILGPIYAASVHSY